MIVMDIENRVHCSRFKKEMEGLAQAPIQGPVGEIILEHVSREAWQEWLEVQIKIINEERLDLSDEAGQKRLFVQMVKYLGLEDLVNLDQ